MDPATGRPSGVVTCSADHSSCAEGPPLTEVWSDCEQHVCDGFGESVEGFGFGGELAKVDPNAVAGDLRVGLPQRGQLLFDLVGVSGLVCSDFVGGEVGFGEDAVGWKSFQDGGL